MNDVDEADLSNQDNKLYQKLIDRSKTLPPGLKLNSPEALYKFEQIATELLLKKKKSLRSRRPGKSSMKGDPSEKHTAKKEPFAAKD